MIATKATFPLYVTADLAAQKSFYAEHFGFEAVFFEPDFYLHLLNPATGAQIGFMLPDLPNQPKFLRSRAVPEGQVITFEVDGIHTAMHHVESASLDIVFPYKVEDWGQKHFMVRDPAGFILDIVEDERN